MTTRILIFLTAIALASAPAFAYEGLPGSGTLTTTGASADVAAALTDALSGDTVIIPNNSFTWSAQVNVTVAANVTLKGGGTSAVGGGDVTTIVDNFVSAQPMLMVTIPTTGTFRMTGITFTSGGSLVAEQEKDNGTIALWSSGNTANVRIDHCHFNFDHANNYRILDFQDGVFGVVDSNIIYLYGSNSLYISNGRDGTGGNTDGNYEWTLPHGLGGADFIFVEDNQINGSDVGNYWGARVFDSYTAGRIVLRFNNISNAGTEHHATGHAGNDRGPRATEVYNNAFTTTWTGAAGNPNQAAINMQSGTGVAWGNTWNQVFKSLYSFGHPRVSSATYAQAATPAHWGYTGPVVQTGTVNVTGTAVTKASGPDFDVSWPANTMILITGASSIAFAGQAAGQGNPIPDSCAIASVNSTISITLTNGGHVGTPSTLNGATYYIASAWDGNTNAYGYPALDQPGRGQGDEITGDFPTKVNSNGGTISWPNQISEPIYFWKNTGTIIPGYGDFVVANNAGVNLVVAGQDYYLSASGIQTTSTSPFDGVTSVATSGVGWGTLANRPTTCTTGVAYWATDQGSWNQTSSNYPHGVEMNGADGVLYKATAPNTWTLFYEPYTYPHPLRADAGAASPGAGYIGRRSIIGVRRR